MKRKHVVVFDEKFINKYAMYKGVAIYVTRRCDNGTYYCVYYEGLIPFGFFKDLHSMGRCEWGGKVKVGDPDLHFLQEDKVFLRRFSCKRVEQPATYKTQRIFVDLESQDRFFVTLSTENPPPDFCMNMVRDDKGKWHGEISKNDFDLKFTLT